MSQQFAYPQALGFIGLGVMGGPMCANLSRKFNSTVHVFDLSAGALAAARRRGAISEDSVGDVSNKADIVFLSLPSITQVVTVTQQIIVCPKKPVMIVDLSTSGVAGTKHVAQIAAEAGVAFIDAPVARRRQAAIDGTLLITVGATKKEFSFLKPFLHHIGTDIVHAGPSGSGQILKLLNNMVLFQNIVALAEAAAIGRGSGLDVETVFSALQLGSADSYALRTTAKDTIAVDNYPEHTFPANYAAKDLRLAVELASSVGVTAEAAQLSLRMLNAAHDRNEGELYYPVIARQLFEQIHDSPAADV